MLLDHSKKFFDADSVTVTATSSAVDAGGTDAGKGRPIGIYAHFSGLAPTTASITVKVTHCATEGGSYTDLLTFETKTGAGPLAESIQAHLPKDHERYLKMTYTVASGPFTAGTITAGLDLGEY